MEHGQANASRLGIAPRLTSCLLSHPTSSSPSCRRAMAPSPGKRRSNRGGRAYAAARSHASTSTASSLPPNTAAAVASASLPASQSSPMTPLPEDESQQSMAPDMSPSSPVPPRPMRGIKRRKPGHPTPLVEQAAAMAARVASSAGGRSRHGDADVEAEDPEAVREQNLFDGWKEEYHDSESTRPRAHTKAGSPAAHTPSPSHSPSSSQSLSSFLSRSIALLLSFTSSRAKSRATWLP